MRLTVVGCSGSYPGPDSPASCYLLEAPHDDGTGERTWRVLLDLGNGALGSLQNFADPLAIDAVLLSHLHADHCLDLCSYHVLRRYHPEGKQPRIPVWGPAGVADRIARGYDLDPDPGMHEDFAFAEYDAAGHDLEIGPFAVRAEPVLHPVTAFALRVTAGGRTLAYSGDTAPCDGLDRAAAGVDLLLAEASFRHADDNPPGIHLTGRECGELADRAGVPRLVITHVPPWYSGPAARDEALTVYAGDVQVAAVGQVHDI
ncbi:MBL fold metallo-hydrolase [Nocardioides sp. CFH 31398]|uniref:MBL fold metallo-hydrolase n=1 Tax=Nocardioides sp. CFH 31398 TaxID=2919579 RepID=UPI001F060A31|nr:MBL fold metallo-hydrolase [Nocardioides sp. CFH 31398]MCH1867165.1 MBL fold metallo-hydrolase [Nocardioides sp. CFH 31398]